MTREEWLSPRPWEEPADLEHDQCYYCGHTHMDHRYIELTGMMYCIAPGCRCETDFTGAN